MSADAAANYEQLKTLLLAHIGISTADRMASWLDQRMDSNDTLMQAALRMQEAARVCTRQCKTVEDVMVSLELLYKTRNPRVATYIRAQKSTTLTEMARASDDYVSSMQKPKSYMWELEQQLPKRRFQQWQPTKKPDSTLQWRNDQQAQPTMQTWPQQHQQLSQLQQQNKHPKHRLPKYFDIDKGPLCFNCRQWGHIGVNCPSKNILLVNKKATTPAEQTLLKLYMMGQVEGHTTRLLDSAADHSLINTSFVRQLGTFGRTMLQPTSTVRVKGVHGKIMELPVIKLACHLLGDETQTEMVVSDDICHDDLLGLNCPLLFKLLHAATDDNTPETWQLQDNSRRKTRRLNWRQRRRSFSC